MLTLHYIPEDEWHGELRVEARHGAFSGEASAWFNAEALRQFVEPLRAFPPQLEVPTKLLGGHFSDSTTSSAPVETHVGITIAQRGNRGRTWAEVILAEPDDEVLPHSAILRFYVEPYALMRFADQVDAMLENGGSAGLPASNSGLDQPSTLTARHKLQRPYTLLFQELHEACNSLIARMEHGSSRQLPPDDLQMLTEEWEQYDPGLIIGTIDWHQGILIFNWAIDDENPIRAARSPCYTLDLQALKREAQAADHPRIWFESYALFLLSAAQDHLGDFFRDGPTDDIPFNRHLIYARGMAETAACIWIGKVVFKFEDQLEQDAAA